MMSMKKNKLSIVTALIVGTTMLSPLEKAWGMNDEEVRKSSTSNHVTVAPRFLVGTTLVSEAVRKAAAALLGDLEAIPDVASLSKTGLAARKALTKDGTLSRENLKTLAQGGFLKVMDGLYSQYPELPLDTQVINSLKAIVDAQQDPYNEITSGKDKPVIDEEERDHLRERLVKAKATGILELEFRGFLPNLSAAYPAIINSLLARFPQNFAELQTVGAQGMRLQEYFSGVSTKPTIKKPNQQRRKAGLNRLAEAFYFLKQIDDSSIPLPSPAIQPEVLQPSASNSSSISSLLPALLVEEEASAMMGGGASTPYDVSQEEAKVIAAPVPLRRALYNPPENVAITEENGVITVRTDNRGLHKYQLESERIPVTPGDRLKISYNITSSEDGIVLGLLKTHRNGWLPESKVALKQGNQQGTVEVKVPEGESLPFFVFYNDQTRTPSTEVTIHDLTIEKEEVKR